MDIFFALRNDSRRAFTLIELLVVISIISLLSSIIFAGINTAREKARDAKRLSDIKQIRNALELYYSINGAYPTHVAAQNPACSTWAAGDSSGDSTHLLENGIPDLQNSPINFKAPSDSTTVDCAGYKYIRIRYPECFNNKYFYVLGITSSMETVSGRHQSSPGLICKPNSWSTDISDTWNYVIQNPEG